MSPDNIVTIPLPSLTGSPSSEVMDAESLQESSPLVYPRISVVMPTLNEADNLPYVLPRIPAGVHELIIVDGCSIDSTIEVARRLFPGVRIIPEGRRGKGAALRAGLREATGDIVVTLDADGSMDPAEIHAFVGAVLAGADYAKGSRFLQGGGTADMGRFRFFGNWAFRTMVKFLFGGKYSDLCYGYNAFRREVLPQLDLSADGFEIETLINVSALANGLNVTEVSSYEAPRLNGKSHLRSIPDGWRIFKTIVFSSLKYRRKPRSARAPRRKVFPETVRWAGGPNDRPVKSAGAMRQANQLPTASGDVDAQAA